MKLRFQDITMQRQYEDLVKHGMHYKTAERKIIKAFEEYDKGEVQQ
jgi:hypothetical protein